MTSKKNEKVASVYYSVEVDYRVVFRGSLVECKEVARREREAWGPLYVINVERIDCPNR